MTVLQISKRERLLLGAALRSDAGAAIGDWQRWSSEIELEEAPYPELRLLTAVYANFGRVAPSYELPRKLKGAARATFIKNHLYAQASIPLIDAIAKQCPVILTKGLGMCVRFDSWSARTMVDVDIHVPLSELATAAQVLVREGWVPQHGMTWDSLVNRIALRRDSWNFTKGPGEIDLHWRVTSGPSERWLTQRMWDSAEQHVCYGRKVLLQSPEFAAATIIAHGFNYGTQGDALQTVIDAAALLPVCKAELLLPLVQRFGLLPCLQQLLTVLRDVGASSSVSHLSRPAAEPATPQPKTTIIKRLGSRAARPRLEQAVLRHPFVYRVWESLGRKPRLERFLLRGFGPFSKPLAPSLSATSDYDLRACTMIDQLGGPGWAWPEPGPGAPDAVTCFWSDRADARLLIPLRGVGDHLLVLTVAEHGSPNGGVDVFANGSHVARMELRHGMSEFQHCFLIPRRLLFGAWVELSFRPAPYRGNEVEAPEDYPLMRCLPARRLQVVEAVSLAGFINGQHIPDLQLKVLAGEEPYAGQFARLKAKAQNSSFREHAALPADFDPYRYVLLHADLLAAEVDPYEHFVAHGKSENRPWR